MKKILIIHNIISPIRVYLFNELNRFYADKGISFKVLFLSETDKNRDWKREKNMNFDFEILDNFAIRIHGKDLNTFFINKNVLSTLDKEWPDVIISDGWDNFASYVANYWCRKHGKKYILWSGSTAFEKSWRRTLFSPLVNYLIKRTEYFLAYGTRAKEYLISIGAKAESIQILYNAIDVNYFSENSEKFDATDKNNLKEKLGIETSKTILFSGRLIRMKGIFEMIEGFEKYYKHDSDVSLLLMGSGPDENKLKKIIASKNIKNVIFTKFIQYAELYKYYSISDLLLFPTRQDIWGLVINEAMACGLPIITTNVAGAGADLVEEGKNGYIIKPDCAKDITEAIGKVFENNLHHANNSKELIQKTKLTNILENIKL
jgi:glycosyltransferase involved in cell wall biosynthesis